MIVAIEGFILAVDMLTRMPMIRRIALGLWLFLVFVLSILYAFHPDLLRPETLVSMLDGSGQSALLAYVILSIVRAFTLIPSTVMILVGMLLFPDRPIFVMTSSLVGIVASSAVVYFFFEFLGLGDFFELRHAKRVRWLKDLIGKRGFLIVVAWSAFPLVPTDVICYVAGSLRMHVWTFLFGVALGELPLVAFYVLLGGIIVGM